MKSILFSVVFSIFILSTLSVSSTYSQFIERPVPKVNASNPDVGMTNAQPPTVNISVNVSGIKKNKQGEDSEIISSDSDNVGKDDKELLGSDSNQQADSDVKQAKKKQPDSTGDSDFNMGDFGDSDFAKEFGDNDDFGENNDDGNNNDDDAENDDASNNDDLESVYVKKFFKSHPRRHHHHHYPRHHYYHHHYPRYRHRHHHRYYY